jgi:hypothetical protein
VGSIAKPRNYRAVQSVVFFQAANIPLWIQFPIDIKGSRRGAGSLLRLEPNAPRPYASYLAELFAAAASNSCALTIALSAAFLAHSSSLGVASGYCLPISLHAAKAAPWTRFSSSKAST